jgi:hypothetical protein
MARVDFQLVTLAHAMSNLHTAIGQASSELVDRGEGSSTGRHAYDASQGMFGSGFQTAGPSSGMMPDPSAWGQRPSSSSGSASRPRAPGYAELASGQGSRKRTSSDFSSLLESPLAVPQSLAAGSTSMDAWATGPSFAPHVVGPSVPLASRQHDPAATSRTTSHGDPYSRPGSSSGVSSSAPTASVQQLLALMRARGELPREASADGQHAQPAAHVQRQRTASSSSERPGRSGRASDDTSSSGASQAASPADAPLLSLSVPPPSSESVAGFHQPTVATELAGCTADVDSCCWGMLNCKDGTILL